MASLKQLFEKQQAGFTVYSPDCTESRLWGNLDHAIHEATGFQVVYRQWINHDINSIMQFYAKADEEKPAHQDPEEAAKKYDLVPATDLRYGHLVVKLFLSGPSLITMWHGNNAIETLLKLKGVTHPAEASSESIRGRFWCDNSVCNLIHVSDNYVEAEREIKAVALSHVLDEEVAQMRLIDITPLPISYAAHSGISVVCDLVNRMLMTMNNTEANAVQLPSSGDAKESNRLLTAILQETAKNSQTGIADFIDSYLSGDVVKVTHMLKQMPVTKWEHFIIQCGAITRYKWNTTGA